MMKLDSRTMSQNAHKSLTQLKQKLNPNDHKKASNLVQGLTAYISTWGLHRLSGDAKKFLAERGEDTKYKGKVYRKFLHALKKCGEANFDLENEASLMDLPLREYTSLNRLAIRLAKEWSFWATAVLGEADEG